MHRFFLYLFFLPQLALANWDQFVGGTEDPSMVHHVNAISGHLNLSFQDVTAQGVLSIPLNRTYSSIGAFQSAEGLSIRETGWTQSIAIGWNLIPHLHLSVFCYPHRTGYKAFTTEPNGHQVAYFYSHKQNGAKHQFYFKPNQSIIQASGLLSSRTNPQKNLLYLDQKEGVAVLSLPNGGERIYRGKPCTHFRYNGSFLYLLDVETLPNKQKINYFYDSHKNLTKIETRNPKGDKVYAAINFDYSPANKNNGFHLKVSTSDQKKLEYRAGLYEKRDCLHAVHTNFRPPEKANFQIARKGLGPRLSSMALAGKELFHVQYYTPPDKKHEENWAAQIGKIHFPIDKVKSISLPVGPQGEHLEIMNFFYDRFLTRTVDSDGMITYYHHDGSKLEKIFYCDPKDQAYLRQTLYWKDRKLTCKAMLDKNNQPIFAKTFSYSGDDIVEEVLWGQLTGHNISDLQINSDGKASGAECYRKTYSYYENNHNLLHTEKEEEGLCYEYIYKPETDLIEAKFTKNQQGSILIREFYFYDEDHLSIAEIIDNGNSVNSNNLTNVTQRLEKTIERNADSGLPETIIESYRDAHSGEKKLLKKTKPIYVNQKICEEAIYDAEDVYRYTIYTEYDDFGNIKRQTTPLGRENTYKYNELGLLEFSEELSSVKKFYKYDQANRPISCTELNTGKEVLTSYDAKDRVTSQTDAQGNKTVHTYDAFGHKRSTIFPASKDEQGRIYQPIASFDYNAQGDLISTTMPSGETTQTSYNLFGKPIRIIQADGHEITYLYQPNGTLIRTTYGDGTQEHYDYDLFQRMICKTIYSSSHEILSEEKWEYNAFHLSSYTDPKGVVTRMVYDGAGRKIEEESAGRKITFSYDALGFLEKTDNGIVVSVQKHNIEGLVTEQLEEDVNGRIENRMYFIYDEQNRKAQAIRITSQGEAVDQFEYDQEKLVRHTDPEGAVTQFIYDENFMNEQGQKVLRKTVLDPLCNALIETYDAAGRLVCREKKDPEQKLVSREDLFYDRSGNQAKRVSYIYLDGILQREISVCWKYDSMGRIIEETEGEQKTTTFAYDLRGFLYKKTLPDGLQIFSIYDPIGRLLRQYSSDETMNDQYFYDQGSNPICIVDHVQNLSIERVYNLFGEILSENTSNHSMRWDYDSIGRCQAIHLPDGSSIDYQHKGSHLTAVERKDGSGNSLYCHRYQEFDPNGHIAEEQLIFNLGSIQTTHNLLERPSHQSSSWLTHSISYGPSGLVKAVNNTLFGNKNYEYDPLNQMIKEGEKTYHFDSLGNPASYHVNNLNQVISSELSDFSYDPNGNLCRKSDDQKQIDYKFDPKGRLTEIIYPREKKLRYLYDPLSRLFSKETHLYLDGYWQKQEKIFYLYDQDKEIGTMDEQGNILELKVLGAGIKGDIGATIALEIGSAVYAPLHDFSGHIIALLSRAGELVETYDIDAFGQEKSPASPISCWRFCSKRSEEGLIFFGLRFYDPSLGRWLTPDPAGFVDGANLYAYVNNSPINRLDLFGLAGEDPNNLTPLQFNMSISSLPRDNQLFRHKILEGGVYTDYVVSCGYWHQLNFTPQETENNSFNLLTHSEIMPSDGRIGLVSYRHGINTQFSEFFATCQSFVDQLPGTLFIGRYHGTEGLIEDTWATTMELRNIETREVVNTRQFLISCSALCKVNPTVAESSSAMQSLWAHYNHSRGGLIDLRAMQGMAYDQKKALQTQLLLTSIAPAMTTSRDFGMEIKNYYSNQDLVTLGLGVPAIPLSLLGRCIGSGIGGKIGSNIGGLIGHVVGSYCFDRGDCDIEIVPCRSKWSERTFGLADHGILGGTYKDVLSKSIKSSQTRHGFYNGNSR